MTDVTLSCEPNFTTIYQTSAQGCGRLKDVMRRMIDPVSTQRGMGCNGMRDPWLLTFGRTLSGVE
jgi:hypothetical protein